MQIHKNEITTGLLVVITFGLLLAVLSLIGLPGFIRPVKTFRIYFDNASGIHPGAPVLLAGRAIGKVTSLRSPIPMDQRPLGHPDCEISIDVQVEDDAKIYRTVTAHLMAQGLMGQPVIDFIRGDETSGLAQNHADFIGKRVHDISEQMADDVKRLTGPDSDLAITLEHLKTETAPDSDMVHTLQNLNLLTAPNANLNKSIASVKELLDTLNTPRLPRIILNTQEFTDTLKREPWRLVWHSTKTYPGDPNPAPVKK